MRYSALMSEDLSTGSSPASGMPLIGEGDPPPVELVNAHGSAKVILTCDHASGVIPRALGSLGLERARLRGHVCWDIGAAELGRALSAMLDAPLVLAGYSRLVIDLNRGLDDPTLVSVISDGAIIAGNRNVTAEDKARRADAFYHPYHDAIDGLIEGFESRGIAPAMIPLHSFTSFLNGRKRPWQFGILWRRDARIAKPLIERLRARAGLNVGDNEPYSGRNGCGYSLEAHAEARGLPHALLEIRQDLIETKEGATGCAGILAEALAGILDDPGLYRVRHF